MPTSNFYTILESVQTQCATVVPNSVIRRRLYRLESDAFPIVYVVPRLPAGGSIYRQTFGAGVQYKYDVTVCYVQAGAEDLITGLDNFLSIREQLRNILYQPSLTGASQVFDTDQQPDDVVKFAEFLGTDFDVASWTFSYIVSESRTSENRGPGCLHTSMSLTACQLNAVLSWTLAKANPGYGNTTEGPDSANFSYTGLNSAVDQLFASQYTIAASGTQTIDCTSLTNLVSETFSFAHVYAIIVLPVGSTCSVGPGASNPLQWFFGGTTQTIDITDGGMLLYAEPPAGPGAVVNGTAKTITLTNTGGASLTVEIVLVGSTT